MHEKSDMELLRDYIDRHCDEAFSAIVRRHISLVSSTALRITRDHDLADDVTQAVFVILSRKARSLSANTIVPAWLYRTARFAAADALKAKYRRQRREQEAIMTNTESESDSAWEEVAPFLDTAMASLAEKDRNAILLRFFENKSLADVGRALGISDDTAQKRVARGIEKLRSFLGRRKVPVRAGSLATLLSAQAGAADSMRSAEAVCAMATGGSNLSTSTAAIVKGTLHMFMTMQLKKAALLALSLFIAGGAATLVAERLDAKSGASAASTPIEALATLSRAVTTPRQG